MEKYGSQGWIRVSDAPNLPPPRDMTGVVGWLGRNLFSTWGDGILTFVLLSLLAWVVYPVVDWAIIRGVWSGVDRVSCLATTDTVVPGACWIFVWDKFAQWIYGFYEHSERWRVNIVFSLGALSFIWLLVPSFPRKAWSIFFLFVFFPLFSYFLLLGSEFFGLEVMGTYRWGGLLVTLVVAVTGILCSLPLGILLALGRRSQLPVIKTFCIIFIESWRGVPLITVLFMSSFMLPLFLPHGMTFDQLLRCLVGVAFFSSAYMAEVVRGGLQAVGKGQYEAAQALGLGYWRTTFLIILPQALKIVIPGIVNTFIGLFKDTTLVSVVGLFDFLGIVRAAFSDATWITPETAKTGYFFTAFVFWVFCFAMSRYSIFIERHLATGHKK